jgi:hypothetical protein
VAHQFLHGRKIRASIQEVAGKSAAQIMGRKLGGARLFTACVQNVVNSLIRQRLPRDMISLPNPNKKRTIPVTAQI